MALKNLQNSAAPYTCPKCNMKGESYKEINGILKCTTEDCDVNLYYSESSAEAKTKRLKRLEMKKCPFCNSRNLRGSSKCCNCNRYMNGLSAHLKKYENYSIKELEDKRKLTLPYGLKAIYKKFLHELRK